jgi:hypothetical protein
MDDDDDDQLYIFCVCILLVLDVNSFACSASLLCTLCLELLVFGVVDCAHASLMSDEIMAIGGLRMMLKEPKRNAEDRESGETLTEKGLFNRHYVATSSKSGTCIGVWPEQEKEIVAPYIQCSTHKILFSSSVHPSNNNHGP